MQRMLALVLSVVMLLPGMAEAKMWDDKAPSSFADVVEPLLPAVVNISTAQKVKSPPVIGFQGLPPEFENEPALAPFRELFRGFGAPGVATPRQQKVTSLGSGFVIAADGYIVTNNHVIADATEITVTFHDDKKLKAKIIGRDPKTDLALLKVAPSKPLAHVAFGDSDRARVGDWVVAIGNPFGLGGSVTAGIVSARGRNINAGAYDDFIQTDAAINRGNSGGPLFNVAGEVIGVNSAIFSPTGTNIGIGFAVPSSMASKVIAQLKATGKIRRGWLGVRIQPVNEEVAQSMGLKEAKGALVLDINRTGPAAGSGLKPADVIIRFNGKPVGAMRSLPRLVAEAPVGERAEIVVLREGREKTLSVRLGELPDDAALADMEEAGDGETTAGDAGSTQSLLGLQLRPLSRSLAQQFGLPASLRGLLVLQVRAGSAAEEKGIEPRDVILSINQQSVADAAEAKALVHAAKRSGRGFVLLRVLRGRSSSFVTLPVE